MFKESFDLLPSLIAQYLTTENTQRISDKEIDIIQLKLLNRHFHQTVKIKEQQENWAVILLNNGNEQLITHYKIINE